MCMTVRWKVQNIAKRNWSSKEIEKNTGFMDQKAQYGEDTKSPQIDL